MPDQGARLLVGGLTKSLLTLWRSKITTKITLFQVERLGCRSNPALAGSSPQPGTLCSQAVNYGWLVSNTVDRRDQRSDRQLLRSSHRHRGSWTKTSGEKGIQQDWKKKSSDYSTKWILTLSWCVLVLHSNAIFDPFPKVPVNIHGFTHHFNTSAQAETVTSTPSRRKPNPAEHPKTSAATELGGTPNRWLHIEGKSTLEELGHSTCSICPHLSTRIFPGPALDFVQFFNRQRMCGEFAPSTSINHMMLWRCL